MRLFLAGFVALGLVLGCASLSHTYPVHVQAQAAGLTGNGSPILFEQPLPVVVQLADGGSAIILVQATGLDGGPLQMQLVAGPDAGTEIGAVSILIGSATPSASNPMPARPTDGTSFYVGAKTGQLPSALGQTNKAGSTSVTLASDQTPVPTQEADGGSLHYLLLKDGGILEGAPATAGNLETLACPSPCGHGSTTSVQVFNAPSGYVRMAGEVCNRDLSEEFCCFAATCSFASWAFALAPDINVPDGGKPTGYGGCMSLGPMQQTAVSCISGDGGTLTGWGMKP